ncbi:MAG: M55 family metallopeptidase [Thermoguttaceae bacterium]|nr:M55 family metallopeptidase [Thermoguttaceae bacterium]
MSKTEHDRRRYLIRCRCVSLLIAIAMIYLTVLFVPLCKAQEDGSMVRPKRTSPDQGPRIYLCTDLEGVAGVFDSLNWCLPDGKYFEEARRLLMGEINAAVQGFFDGGAFEVCVLSGHGSQSVIPELLHEDALVQWGYYPGTWPARLDKGYDALAYVGQHSKAGTPGGQLSHTGSMHVIDRRINGLSVGEFGQMALCAKELGIPTIFGSGDEAFCREAMALTPGIETVAVKFGLAADGPQNHRITSDEYRLKKFAAVHLSPAKARKAIYAKAKAAVEKLRKNPKAFTWADNIKPPYRLEMEIRPIRSGGEIKKVVKEHPTSIIELIK